MVLYKQNNRPDHDCIYYFNLRRAQDANLFFHQSRSYAIILHDNLQASALDKVVTFASEVSFEKNPRLQSSRRRLLANELTSRISGRSEVPYTPNEKEANAFLILSLTTQVLNFTKQTDENYRCDQEFFTENDRKSRILACAATRF